MTKRVERPFAETMAEDSLWMRMTLIDGKNEVNGFLRRKHCKSKNEDFFKRDERFFTSPCKKSPPTGKKKIDLKSVVLVKDIF